jgi:hypothetical protein
VEQVKRALMSRPHAPRKDDRSNNRYAHRVIALLNREQVDYLDRLGKDAQFSSGFKLSRTQILATMVNVLKRLSLTGEGITRVAQFEQRIVDAIMNKSRGGKRDVDRM